jgi:hypothetical protein
MIGGSKIGQISVVPVELNGSQPGGSSSPSGSVPFTDHSYSRHTCSSFAATSASHLRNTDPVS